VFEPRVLTGIELETNPGVNAFPVTQLDDVPVNAKFVKVPVFVLPDKSVAEVTVVFVPPAVP